MPIKQITIPNVEEKIKSILINFQVRKFPFIALNKKLEEEEKIAELYIVNQEAFNQLLEIELETKISIENDKDVELKKSSLYNKERDIYNKIDNYPHLIIILKIPIEVSVSRKPEEHSDPKRVNNLKKKIKAITSIEKLPNLFVVDATQSYEAVQKEVKSIIWNNI